LKEPEEYNYDTDGILEQQTQTFKICKKCSGVNTIRSRSDTGYNVFAITIPRDACSDCIDEGYKMYKNASNEFTNVYLQDRVNDEYLAK